MIEEFQKFIREEGLIPKGSKILVAVSGGVDSMVLVDLFKKTKQDFEVAHCNFQLRGEESDGDQLLVEKFCKDFGIAYHVKKFPTNSIAEVEKMGIQELARKLRYEWFSELMEENSIDLLATAHHKDDSVETMLFNLTRGGGLKGLKGIDPKRSRIIRPLLFAEKSEIRAYAKKYQIPFREDSSNLSDKYSRNKIRHRIIPELKEVNASLVKTLYEKSKIFREGSDLIQKTIDAELDGTLLIEGDLQKLKIAHLKKSTYRRLLLWQWLEKFEFTSAMIEEVNKFIDSQTGKKIESSSYSLFIDREFLVLSPRKTKKVRSVRYNSVEDLIQAQDIRIEIIRRAELKVNKDSAHAYFDQDAFSFPVERRVWKAGDRFIPFGRKKEEKVKDFLTHQKVSSVKKSEVQVLCSGDQIIWLLGWRIDDRFKVGAKTQNVLHLELIN